MLKKKRQKISPIRWVTSLGGKVKRKVKQSLTDRKVEQYIQKNNLRPLIDEARGATDSTGADDSDYVLLHSYVRSKKPLYVLECGTGLTTWIIAHALQQNWLEADQADSVKGIVVSIEEDAKWHDHAVDAMADRYRSFVEFVHAEREYFHYSFIYGVTYETVPDYPYELMFVDGPVCRYYPSEFNDEYQNTVAMDLVKLLLRRNLNLTVLIDNLKRTQIAYSCLFKPGSLKHYQNLSNIGVLENVSRSDLLIDTTEYIPTFKKFVKKSRWKLTPSFCKGIL